MQLIEQGNMILQELKASIGSMQDDATIAARCKAAWHALKELFLGCGDVGQQEEIHFFKVIKADVSGIWLYHQTRRDILRSIPPDNPLVKERVLKRELKGMKKFFRDNSKLYMYYRSNETYFDPFLFLRSSNHNSVYATIGDRLFARFRAAEAIGAWLCAQDQPPAGGTSGVLTWTAPKAALAELIYALQTCGVFNQTQADIATITKAITQSFNLPIGNIYKIYEEIRLRKKNRTPFLDTLKIQLDQRMNRDDEHAL